MTVVTAGMVLGGIVVAALAAVVIAYLLSVVWAWATTRPRSEFWRNPRQVTVEAEQDATREATAYASQWAGITARHEPQDVYLDPPQVLDSHEADYSHEYFAAFRDSMRKPAA